MPECQKCGFQWAWKDSLKISFKNNKKCPNCAQRQYVTPTTKKRHLLFYFLPSMILITANPLFHLNDAVFFFLLFSLALVMMVTVPYTITLSNEQKPLW
ncbi:MAG: TIGR04104 family putative zinc finger protein [Bacillota bacterium]